MNKKIALALVFFLIGFAVSLIFFSTKLPSLPTTSQVTPTPLPTIITLRLPAVGQQGVLMQTSGTVTKIPWDSFNPAPATPGGMLYQSEEIETKEKSTALLSFPQAFHCALGENTIVYLSSLLPNHALLQQRKGTTTYDLDSPSALLSVRIPGVLVELSQGEITIEVTDKTLTILVPNGKAKVAKINPDNVTQVWQLTNKDRAVINRISGSVNTSGILLSQGTS